MALDTILVTGGTGFIGSHLVESLVRSGQTVRVLGTSLLSLPPALAALEGDFEIHEGDIRDPDAVSKAMLNVDHVFHMAGLGSPASSIEQYRAVLDVNVIGTENVLQSAVKQDVARVVFSSSASVYGDSPISPKTESMLPAPKSVYAVSKLTGEIMCSVFGHRYGLETVSLRYFNVFGPGQDRHGNSPMVVPSFVRSLQAGVPVTLFGDGSQTRDFIYIDDVVEATVLSSSATGVAGRVINIASGQPTRILDLVNHLSEAIGVDPKIVCAPEREKEVGASVADVSLAEEILGFKPRVPLREGLGRLAASFHAAAR